MAVCSATNPWRLPSLPSASQSLPPVPLLSCSSLGMPQTWGPTLAGPALDTAQRESASRHPPVSSAVRSWEGPATRWLLGPVSPRMRTEACLPLGPPPPPQPTLSTCAPGLALTLRTDMSSPSPAAHPPRWPQAGRQLLPGLLPGECLPSFPEGQCLTRGFQQEGRGTYTGCGPPPSLT